MPLSCLIFRVGRVHAPTEREKLSLPVFLGLISICFGLTYGGQILGDLVNSVIGFFTGKVSFPTFYEGVVPWMSV